eukprot:TRINITY_DN7055_c0_g1_i11.p2 TRINITY_DN7055_c0_g1~~TRINITY_DN7055_c0_g1_i11.p2  ORF type:complete len:101 (-),score=16.45 TRINITY_DN7055_c0_g1_i11:80-382(-)
MAVSSVSVKLDAPVKAVPDTSSHNAAISVCEKDGQWQSALNLLSWMPQSKVVPNLVSYSAAISASEKGGVAVSSDSFCSHQCLLAVSSDSVKLDAPVKGC